MKTKPADYSFCSYRSAKDYSI